MYRLQNLDSCFHLISTAKAYVSHYFVCLSIYPSIHLSIHLSIFPSIDLSMYIYLYLSMYIYPYIFAVIHPSIHPSTYVSTCLCIYPFINLTTYLSIYLSVILILKVNWIMWCSTSLEWQFLILWKFCVGSAILLSTNLIAKNGLKLYLWGKILQTE